MIYRTFAVLALVAAVIATIVLSGPQTETVPTVTTEAAPPDTGYKALKARLIQTGPDGHPLYTLTADEIRQTPQESTVHFEQVLLGFRDTSGNQWNASASHGQLGQDTGTVELSGDVHVTGMLPGMQQSATITTDRLSLDTRAQIVSTEDPVKIAWSGNQLDAAGLRANLKEERLRLKSGGYGLFKR